ncbi:Cytoplasmic tRNA 2-thiolation protein 2 A [Sarcoptes scabiei]|nr:Cytoplasmic tRNA 2-thiolation protein 2 A [Sarcoptes scabiei]
MNQNLLLLYLLAALSIFLLLGPSLARSNGIALRPGSQKGPRRYRCGYNRFWNQCGSSCPDTCQNYLIPRGCTLQCIQRCDCRPGYVLLHAKSNQCVPRNRCPNRKGIYRNGNRRYYQQSQRNQRNLQRPYYYY